MSSLSELLQRIESGDPAAEQMLWEGFHQKLLRHVQDRIRLRGIPPGLLDDEAVAVSVLESVFKCAKQGRLQGVQNWTEMSQLLFAMTNRKFVDHWRRATTQKAYPGVPIQSLLQTNLDIQEKDLTGLALAFEEQLAGLMKLLPDELHREIAVLKLAEYTLAEISVKINRAIPTVDRKWRTIRRIWADELQR